ncbi:hypothetical protein B0J11DRAFT_134553 [Dendryphion nanum]|uniref:Uncharacterized protein n=1 Tax=Dendryphion nanum TaxID=256645 RepID=A0A9P9IC03_9PLEO|nr:hypothetical protein B0J11DRAFT_134553 [Dendryphion nanum]
MASELMGSWMRRPCRRSTKHEARSTKHSYRELSIVFCFELELELELALANCSRSKEAALEVRTSRRKVVARWQRSKRAPGGEGECACADCRERKKATGLERGDESGKQWGLGQRIGNDPSGRADSAAWQPGRRRETDLEWWEWWGVGESRGSRGPGGLQKRKRHQRKRGKGCMRGGGDWEGTGRDMEASRNGGLVEIGSRRHTHTPPQTDVDTPTIPSRASTTQYWALVLRQVVACSA